MPPRLINEPPKCSQRELQFSRDLHANAVELAKGITDVLVIRQNPGIGRPRGDTESIMILSQPYDTFSEVAQQTGKFFHERHTLVDAETRQSLAISSSQPVCGTCWNVLIYLDPGEYTKKRRSKEEGSAVIHHEDLVSLGASAESACGICKPLHARIFRSFSSLAKYRNIRLECSWLAVAETAARRTIFFSATQTTEERTQHNYMNLYWLQTYASEVYKSNFDLPDFDRRNRGESTDSSFCKELAQHWLQRCRQNADSTHHQCQERNPDWLPARLLDVASARRDGWLRLVPRDQIAMPQNYMTVSYVWGPYGRTELPLLYSWNLEQRKHSGVEIALLPKTLREVLDVANWLGNSFVDWQREADSMSLTYRNAHINVSADATPDPSGGLFVQRDSARLEPWSISLGPQTWYLTMLPQWGFTDVESTASYWRAWIYRERQLAPRTLHFTPKEIAWECCSPRYCSEKYPGGAPFALHSATYGGESKYQIMMHNASTNADNNKSIHTSWELLCNSFSCRELANLSDMPVIIASLAADFAAILPDDKYIAGMWGSRLPHCLLWTTKEMCDGDTNEEMPSWSWLHSCNTIEAQHRLADVPILKVVSTDLREDQPLYNPNRVASLTVCGFWRKLRLEYVCNLREVTTYSKGYVENVFLDDAEDKRPLGISYNEEDGDKCIIHYDRKITEHERSYHCLLVTINQSQNERRIRGFLLQQVDTEEHGKKELPHFRRMGTIEFLEEMALRVRYRLPNGSSDEEDSRWNTLEHEFRWAQANDTSSDVNDRDPSDVDPFRVYEYDIDNDYSWLVKLEPKVGVLV